MMKKAGQRYPRHKWPALRRFNRDWKQRHVKQLNRNCNAFSAESLSGKCIARLFEHRLGGVSVSKRLKDL